MVELFAVVIIAAVLGGVAGAVAAFTHQLFITKAIAKLHAEYEKLEAWKASQEEGEATLVAGLKDLELKAKL